MKRYDVRTQKMVRTTAVALVAVLMAVIAISFGAYSLSASEDGVDNVNETEEMWDTYFFGVFIPQLFHLNYFFILRYYYTIEYDMLHRTGEFITLKWRPLAFCI